MKKSAIVVLNFLCAVWIALPVGAMDMNDMHMHGSDTSMGPMSDTDAKSEYNFTFGHPGKADKVDRTIKINALDSMKFSPQKLKIRTGETVRFIVTNQGKLKHELVIGDAKEQKEHAQEMKDMPNMAMHDDANGVSVEPGQSKTLIWQFNGPGTVELACHEPGHYEAGMVSKVIVKK